MRNTYRRIFISVLLFVVLLSSCKNISSGNVQPTDEPAEVVVESTDLPVNGSMTEIDGVDQITTEEFTSEFWMRKYGGVFSEEVHDILQADDGGFYILGATDIAWEPVRSAHIYLFRTDKYGEVLWEKALTADSFSLGQSLTYTNNDTILIAGVTRSDEASSIDILMMEVDLEGNLLESNTLKGEMDEWVHTVIQTEDGGLILFGNIINLDDYVTDPGVAGYGGFEYRSSIYMVRLDQNGEELWSRTLDNGENVVSGFAEPALDGGFYILSTVYNYPDLANDMLLVKIDGDGNNIWSHLWDEGKTSSGSMLITPEGNLLIGAVFSPSGDSRYGDADYLLVEVDDQGVMLWETIFGTPDMVDMVRGVIQTEDDGYLLLGDRSQDLFRSESDLVMIKLDKNREIIWEKTIDQKPHFMVRNLSLTDGGYFIAATVYTGSYSDILLVKTDLGGNIAN